MSVTALTEDSDDVGTEASFVTASISPTSGAGLLAVVANRWNALQADNSPALSGNGLTWSVVATVQFSTRRRLTLLKGVGTPFAGAVTISFSGSTQNSVGWSFFEFPLVANASPVIQSKTNAASGTTASATLDSPLASASNYVFGAFAVDDNNAWTVGSGFTEIHETPISNGLEMLTEVELTPEDETADATQSSAVDDWAVIVAEIDVAGSSLQEVALAGDQPSPSGGIAPVHLIDLAGEQGEPSGRLTKEGDVYGVQPTPSGQLDVLDFNSTVEGVQPTAIGTLNKDYGADLAGNQPASTGGLVANESPDVAFRKGFYRRDIRPARARNVRPASG